MCGGAHLEGHGVQQVFEEQKRQLARGRRRQAGRGGCVGFGKRVAYGERDERLHGRHGVRRRRAQEAAEGAAEGHFEVAKQVVGHHAAGCLEGRHRFHQGTSASAAVRSAPVHLCSQVLSHGASASALI